MTGAVRRHALVLVVALVTASVTAGTSALAAKAVKLAKKAKFAKNAGMLDGLDSTAFAKAGDLTWNNLSGIPAGFADGTDDTGSPGEPAWLLAGNAGTAPAGDFVGTTDNTTLNFRVNDQRAFRLQPDPTSPGVIGGFSGNSVSASGATIGGGGQAGSPNQAIDDFGTVGGGSGNQAGHTVDDADYTTVGGGQNNSATNLHSTVGGGVNNAATGIQATIGGGQGNVASSARATVGGGDFNSATGNTATIGGGLTNTASGTHATVPGGVGADARLWGQLAHASGTFSGPGDAQTSEYVLRETTTDSATPVELRLDGGVISLSLDTGRRMTFEAFIVGGTAGGETAGYTVTGLIERVGATTALVGTPTVTILGEDDSSWTVAVTADNSTDSLDIAVTGDAADVTAWVAMVQTAEVDLA
ncbi:MAG: hypothetical protein M3135_04850 [Actinomycetota bacterium]|nr:hypothetical protein [Actinomycetota bacterium]